MRSQWQKSLTLNRKTTKPFLKEVVIIIISCLFWVRRRFGQCTAVTLEKEMATHSSVLAWRIPGTGKPGGLPFMGSHRVGHNWSDLAAAAAAVPLKLYQYNFCFSIYRFLNHCQVKKISVLQTCLELETKETLLAGKVALYLLLKKKMLWSSSFLPWFRFFIHPPSFTISNLPQRCFPPCKCQILLF